MGGSAFTTGSDPLCTPRMSPAVYHEVKARFQAVLQEVYLVVASPIDGPAKSSFGDVDILVTWPKAQIPKGRNEAHDEIKVIIGAERMIETKGDSSASINLAVPWPEDLLQEEVSLDSSERKVADPNINTDTNSPIRAKNKRQQQERNEGRDADKRRFIQVDVRVCASLEKLEWILFKHAHGDMWNLLGFIIRPFGLTVDEEALCVRVREIEKSNRKQAKIPLTSDPAKVLRFLGLPWESYWEEPFQTTWDAYEYVAKCGMFWVGGEKENTKANEGGERRGETGSGGGKEDDNNNSLFSSDRTHLKASDRRRMKYRPMFQQWIDEFIPHCRLNRIHTAKTTTRAEVTRKALEWFGAGPEFQARRDRFLLDKQREVIWSDIILRQVRLPVDGEGSSSKSPRDVMFCSCLRKALKRILFEDDQSYGPRRDEDLIGPDGLFDIGKVTDWIERNRAAVGEVAMEKSHQARRSAQTVRKSITVYND